MKNSIETITVYNGVVSIYRKNSGGRDYHPGWASAERLHTAVSNKLNSNHAWERPSITLYPGGFEAEW